VDEGEAAAAFRAEIGYYLEHHTDGRDAASLDDLRDRCAAVLRDALGRHDLALDDARAALIASIRFTAYPDARPALDDLRSAGLRSAVCSNWDCSLGEVLRGAGLRDLVDAVVTSAEAGATKPDPRPFRAALRAVGCPPGRALHVGDSPSRDVAGAAATGVRAVLLRRGGERPDRVPADARPVPRPVAEIASLAELPGVL
jgi:putative hydrolase of the HAD superfamily